MQTPIDPFPSQNERFEHVHIDITGPLPPCEGSAFLLTCVDHFSRGCEVFPMTNIEAHTIAKTFIAGWVSCFGVPAMITTDRGRQSESNLFGELVKLLGSKPLWP